MEDPQIIDMVYHRISLFLNSIIDQINKRNMDKAWEQSAQLTGAIKLLRDLYPIFDSRLERVYPKISSEIIETLEQKRDKFISVIETTRKARLANSFVKEINLLINEMRKFLREKAMNTAA
ncbi:hypothetical protein KAJ89_05435 [Candidatus Parcubacteria bacterium]|nr:hypothetical protein [Candidatus Parcubacteria bacterium]